MSDFLTLYPGVYTRKEKAIVEKYLADNKAIEERGQIDISALINSTLPEGTPGVGPVIKVNEEMVRYNNQKYDPENPILNDAGYARKLGYQNILAYPTFGAHDDTFMSPYPSEARDSMGGSGLNHSVTSYKPVYPGDTLYLINNSRHMVDLTPPEGCIYRSAAIQSEGSIYNQKGEKVSDVIFRVTENVKIYKDGKGPKNPNFADKLEAIDWMRRPPHYYTDDDWEFIKDIWAKEKRQGAEPLYWEDVKIGDEPVWTLDGPIEESCVPTPPWGMGLGGSRTMKKEIMDPEIFKTMIRGEKDGIYRLPDRQDYVPPVPDDPATTPMPGEFRPASSDAGDTAEPSSKHTDERGILINYLGRDIAIRHINNWMGDYGWLYNIRWGISSPELQSTYGAYALANPRAERFLDKIPKMKGKFLTTHGITGDVAIVKSYVYDKYVRDDAFLVELGWWIETIDGYIWEEGGATVKLPSKSVAA
jgi:acyl dehydratase